jgi:hypothetical protein
MYNKQTMMIERVIPISVSMGPEKVISTRKGSRREPMILLVMNTTKK